MNLVVSRIVWIVVVVCLLAGCGRRSVRYAWEKELLVADHTMDEGRKDPEAWAEATKAYQKLRPDAHSEFYRRYIDLRLAMILERQGREVEALEAYTALWKDRDEHDEHSAYAVWYAGRMLHRAGDAERAVGLWVEAVRLMPEYAASERAMRALLAHYEGSPELTLVLLKRLYDAVPTSSLGDNLLYERAKLLEAQGDSEAALLHYEALLERFVVSGLRDEARWKVAELSLVEGKLERALLSLRLLAEDRDSSWSVGVYESDLADDARFWMGLLRWKVEKDAEGAEREFSLFLKDFPDSKLRDDARWNLAVLAQRRQEDPRALCEALQREEPKSRWVKRCAQGVGPSSPLSVSGLEALSVPEGLGRGGL